MKKNKIKEVINKIANSIAFPIGIGILLFLKTMFFYYNTVAINEPLEIQTILGTMVFLIVCVCFICVLPNRGRMVSSLVVSIIISILLFGDNVYYTYSNSVLSVAQITNLQYGNDIRKTLPMLINIKQIIYFIDIIIIVFLLITRWIKIEKKDKKTKKQQVMKISTGLVGVILFFIVGIDFVKMGSQKSYNKDFQIRDATIFGYHLADFEHAFNTKKMTKYKNKQAMLVDYKKLKENYELNYGEIQYDLQGILKNKNIIILQLESVQEFLVNKEIDGKQITPNLNMFLKDNIEFTDMHMQSYSTTADSEHSTLTSLYPMENGMSFSKYYTNTYEDLFTEFNNANYFTSYMHGNYPYFWNRGNVYGRLGLNDLSLKEQFEDLSENINGDLSDELLYRQAVEKIKQFDQPFISYIVAASSHTPFILEGLQDRNKVQIDVGKYKNTYFGSYLEAVNYADYAFGIFIEELKKADLYDDTAILVFGDHNGLNMYNEEMLDFLRQTDENMTDVDIKLNYTRVASGFKIPNVAKTKITKPVNKLDIKPTLCYLCDIEDGISLGTNMFTDKDFVSLNNERIISKDYYYDETWYERNSGVEINLDELSEETKNKLQEYEKNMRMELEISNSISVNNLLK